MQMALAGNYTYLQYLPGEFCHHICSHGLHYNQDFIEMVENGLSVLTIWLVIIYDGLTLELGMTYLFKYIINGGYFQ